MHKVKKNFGAISQAKPVVKYLGLDHLVGKLNKTIEDYFYNYNNIPGREFMVTVHSIPLTGDRYELKIQVIVKDVEEKRFYSSVVEIPSSITIPHFQALLQLHADRLMYDIMHFRKLETLEILLKNLI